MDLNNSGGKTGIPPTRRSRGERMAIYDELPFEVRLALQNAPLELDVENTVYLNMAKSRPDDYLAIFNRFIRKTMPEATAMTYGPDHPGAKHD